MYLRLVLRDGSGYVKICKERERCRYGTVTNKEYRTGQLNEKV